MGKGKQQEGRGGGRYMHRGDREGRQEAGGRHRHGGGIQQGRTGTRVGQEAEGMGSRGGSEAGGRGTGTGMGGQGHMALGQWEVKQAQAYEGKG